MADLRKFLDKQVKKITEGLGNLRNLRVKVSHSTLLEISLLSLVILIAVLIRLLPMQWGFYLSEFDPYSQYRIASHMVSSGFLSYTSWIDPVSWWPYGRNFAITSYPGMPATAAVLYLVSQAVGIKISLFQLCVLFPVIIGGGLTCILVYFFGKDIGGKEVGLLAAFFLALSSSHIARTTLGFFNNDEFGVLLIFLFSFLFLRSVESERSPRSNLAYSIVAGLALGYLFASWGGSRYAADITVLFVFIMILLGRYSSRLLLSYSATFGIALFMAANTPYLGLSFLRDVSVLPILGVFLLLCALEINRNIKTTTLKATFLLAFFVILLAGYVILSERGFIRPLETKFLLTINPFAGTSALFNSVAEHASSAWGYFYFTLGIGIFFVPVGLFFAMQNPTNRNVFLVILGLTSIYFSATIVRFLFILAPTVCILWALAFTKLMRPFVTILKEDLPHIGRKVNLRHVGREFSGAFIILMFVLLTFNFVLPTAESSYPRVIDSAYSPTTIAAAGVAIRPTTTIPDWLETCAWIKQNLPQNAVVLAWWDYGYWITVLGNKTTLIDNATFNSTQIKLVAQSLMSNETVAIKIYEKFNRNARSLGLKSNITNVVVFTTFDTNGNDVGYGDEGKASQMANIAEPLTGLNYSAYRSYQTDNSTGAVQDVGWNNIGGDTTLVKLMTYGKQMKLGQTPTVTLDHFKLLYYSKGPSEGSIYSLVCVYQVIY